MADKQLYVFKGNGTVETLYTEETHKMTKRMGDSELTRASHIDPINAPKWWEWLLVWKLYSVNQRHCFVKRMGSGHFGVFWKGPVAIWPASFTDDGGNPFKTKSQAERYEVARLRRDHFNLGGPEELLIENL